MRGKALASFIVGVVLVLVVSAQAAVVATDIIAEVMPLYTTAEDPNNYVVLPGEGFDGVVDLLVSTSQGTFRGSGALLTTGRHILTAAHMVTDNFGTMIANSVSVRFDMPTGLESISASQFTVHPGWDGDFTRGDDVAVLTLSAAAPSAAERYELYRGGDEVGQTAVKAGYGRGGYGSSGATLPSGTKRSGQNKYDALGDIFDNLSGIDPLPGAQLAYDFDNGRRKNDAFNFFYGISDRGLDGDEVMAAPGDSGGPSLLGGEIAGIVSYALRLADWRGRSSDVNGELDFSFGEFAIETRVSNYAQWIDSVLLAVILGDMNGDGAVNSDDINPFVLALTDSNDYLATYGLDPNEVGDMDQSGALNSDDINPFVSLLGGSQGGSAAATKLPEPATVFLLLLGGLAVLSRRPNGA